MLEKLLQKSIKVMRESRKGIKTVLNPFVSPFRNALRAAFLSYLGLSYSGCGGDQNAFSDNRSTAPCVSHQCGENELCARTKEEGEVCICQPGYIKESGICVAELPYAAPDGGTDKEPSCQPQCAGSRAVQSCPGKGEEFVSVQCPDNAYCIDGACRIEASSKPGARPVPAHCQLTDILDLEEEAERKTAAYQRSNNGSYYINLARDACGEDDGYHILHNDNSWVAFTLRVNPPPDADFYRLMLKAAWQGECADNYNFPSACNNYGYCGALSCNRIANAGAASFNPSLNIQFGDFQSPDKELTSADAQCQFIEVGEFSVDGVASSQARINIVGNPYQCPQGMVPLCPESGVDVTKAAIFSCKYQQ